MPPPRPAVPKRKTANDLVARVRAITFNSDHRDTGGAKLLHAEVLEPIKFTGHTGRASQFKSKLSEKNARALLKPDWSLVSRRNDPISHTMGQPIRIDVEILFKRVPGGSATLQQVTGAGGNVVALDFNAGATPRAVKDGDVVTLSNIVSNGSLPTIVGVIEQSISWKAVVNGRPPVPIGVSGPHKIFTTLGQPIGKIQLDAAGNFQESGPDQIVTIPRMEFAVKGAQGADTERRAADLLFAKISHLGVNYVLGFRPAPLGRPNTTGIDPRTSVEHYLWLCNNNEAEGECHVIAASFRLALRMLGCTSQMDVEFMNAHPGRQEHTPDFPRRTDILKGRLSQEATRFPNFHLVFLDGNGDANNFEGVVKFLGALYAIGDAIFDRFTAAQNGLSADDLNTTDYFTDRQTTFPRSTLGDLTKGAFDLKYVDSFGNDAPVQYPWATVTGAPAAKRVPGADRLPFRWED